MSPALQEILRDLERHKQIFDLDRNGLGETLMEIDVDCIERAPDAEEASDGNPWPPRSAAYAEWKAKAAPGRPMASCTGS